MTLCCPFCGRTTGIEVRGRILKGAKMICPACLEYYKTIDSIKLAQQIDKLTKKQPLDFDLPDGLASIFGMK